MRNLPRYFVGALALAALLAALVYGLAGGPAPAPAEAPAPAATPAAEPAPVEAPAPAATPAAEPAPAKAPAPAAAGKTTTFTGEIVLGKADAPVTIIEYASMTCPHCAAFHLNVLPALKEKYIDTGKVKLFVREFPLDGVALRASMLARCGGEAKAYPLIDILFKQQASWAASPEPLVALGRIAKLGGMNQASFDACLADEALMKQLVQSRQDGSDKYEIKGTPSFIIDGKTHDGDMDIEDFDKILQALLPDA